MAAETPIVIYHGTNTIVKNPEVRIVGYNKDFGFGFYCTRYERQAQRWAISKRNPHIVCVYEYIPDVNLRIKTFAEMTDEWLDFIAACRHGEAHPYDIVEDQILFCTDQALRTVKFKSYYQL